MATRPRIAIPLGLDEGGLRRDRETAYLDMAYPAAISRAGGVPILVPIAAGAEAALDGIDGLLLPGGDDFPPPRPHPADVVIALAPEPQRAFDAALLERALGRGLPVLGICYGMQLLALHAGGSLIYDLESDQPGEIAHQGGGGDGVHRIAVEPGTRLESLLGAGDHMVNSRHHQAVENPGAGMKVAARAPDQIIEAIEASGSGFVVGVQWHPEDLEGSLTDRLFGAFLSACASD